MFPFQPKIFFTTPRPFFLFASFDNTHSPVLASKDFTGKSKRGPFGDATMVCFEIFSKIMLIDWLFSPHSIFFFFTKQELDWAVGQIYDAVLVSELSVNTLIVFTSVS